MANALSTEQTAHLGRWLADKWPKGCPCCGEKVFALHSHVTIHIGRDPMPQADLVSIAAVLTGEYLPNVAVICLNCGDTRFVNLFVAGIYTTAITTTLGPEGIKRSLTPAKLPPPPVPAKLGLVKDPPEGAIVPPKPEDVAAATPKPPAEKKP